MNTDQTLNLPAIVRFLSSRDSNLLFLALSFLLAVIIVVFVQPISVFEYTTQGTSLSELAQLALMTVGGFATVTVSRLALSFIASRKDLSLLAITIWIAVELILSIAVTAIMAWSLSGGGPVKLAPLTGDILLGYISILLVPSVISYQAFRLHELRMDLVDLRRKLTTEGLGVSSEQSINFYDKGGRLALSTRIGNVLYIEAADNYANIHYLNEEKEDTFILHNSLKDMEKEYSQLGLLRCHRGYMVNAGNVKLMRKEKSLFMLELNDTAKTIPVSKSYINAVTHYFSSNPSTPTDTLKQ